MKHTMAILVMGFTIQPQTMLITPVRYRSNDRYILSWQEEYHVWTSQ